MITLHNDDPQEETSEQEPIDPGTPPVEESGQEVAPQADEELLPTENEERTGVADQELAPPAPKKWKVKGNNEEHELTEDEVRRRAEMSFGVPNLIEGKKRVEDEYRNYQTDIQSFLNDPEAIVDHLTKHGFDFGKLTPQQEESPNLYPYEEEYADDLEKQRATALNQWSSTKDREISQLRQQVQMLVDKQTTDRLDSDFAKHRETFGVPDNPKAKELVMKALFSGMKQYGASRYNIQHALQEVSEVLGSGSSATNSGKLTSDIVKSDQELYNAIKDEVIEAYLREKETVAEETKTPRAKTTAPLGNIDEKVKNPKTLKDAFAKGRKLFKDKMKERK